MSRFDVKDTHIAGVKLLSRHKIADSRGYLSRLFCEVELDALGWNKPVAQVNETMTKIKGTVRGLHFQTKPNLDMKLVTCLEGEIFDVAVDLRKGSPTFLKHFACNLSAQNQNSLLIPAGFAHGFQTLTDNVRMVYCHSAQYDAKSEGGVNLKDQKIAIDWPLSPEHLSERDLSLDYVSENFVGIEL